MEDLVKSLAQLPQGTAIGSLGNKITVSGHTKQSSRIKAGAQGRAVAVAANQQNYGSHEAEVKIGDTST